MYLYLMFDDNNFVNTENYIFNTEGRILFVFVCQRSAPVRVWCVWCACVMCVWCACVMCGVMCVVCVCDVWCACVMCVVCVGDVCCVRSDLCVFTGRV